MSFYERRVLPWLITRACSVPQIARERAAVVPQAQGDVLEIGAGGGLNLVHYRSDRVSRLIGLDVNAPLLSAAQRKANALGLPFEPLLLDAARVPLGDQSVDTVVMTFTLCSIADPVRALSEIKRVLRPDGSVLFSEHGISPDASVARWQAWVNPAWSRVAGGCQLTRDPVSLLRSAGFVVDPLDQHYLRRVWRGVGWVSSGVARHASCKIARA